MAAKRQSSGNLGKAFFLILLIIVLIIVGSILIDLVANMAGVGINLNIPIITNMRSKSLKKKIRASEDPFLLRQEELNKWEQRLELLEKLRHNAFAAKETHAELLHFGGLVLKVLDTGVAYLLNVLGYNVIHRHNCKVTLSLSH